MQLSTASLAQYVSKHLLSHECQDLCPAKVLPATTRANEAHTMTQNGSNPSRIVAVEDEEDDAHNHPDLDVDDDIPGPPASHKRHSSAGSMGSSGGGGGVSRSRGSIISRVLNISSGKRSPHVDALQLSNTDHGEYVSGSGILASREDLNMAPEACTCPCYSMRLDYG